MMMCFPIPAVWQCCNIALGLSRRFFGSHCHSTCIGNTKLSYEQHAMLSQLRKEFHVLRQQRWIKYFWNWSSIVVQLCVYTSLYFFCYILSNLLKLIYFTFTRPVKFVPDVMWCWLIGFKDVEITGCVRNTNQKYLFENNRFITCACGWIWSNAGLPLIY